LQKNNSRAHSPSFGGEAVVFFHEVLK
jgi:hypothetical protein